MARRKRQSEEDLVQVDIYYVPQAQAEMYQVLREAVAEETLAWLAQQFHQAMRRSDESEGEYVTGLNEAGEEQVRYYLNPQNISQAQKARDKDQLATYLEQELLS